MSATSSSPPASPTTMRPQHNCIECKRLKRACDKKFPCGKCAKAGKVCEYKDPSDDGLYGPISSAKSPQSVAFGTLLEIHHTKPKVKDAVEMYFNGVNTWFTIIERASFEQHLESNWDHLSAEVSVMALCMALVALPADEKHSKGMGDPAYSSIKAALSVVQSKVPLSVQLLQAELLVALYEFSNSMPQQAYLTLGRCFQMTRMFGWHNPAFWSSENQASMDRLKELKLYSILWWAIVYVDCLLNVAYQDQAYPMHTTDVALTSIIPLPEFFDQYFLASLPFPFGPQNQVLQDPNSHLIEGIIFPEANSAWYLSHVLQRLSSPTLPGIDPKTLSEEIWQHARKTASGQWRAGDRNAAVGTDFIALMKLNQPALLGGIDFIPMLDPTLDEAVMAIRKVIGVIHGKAGRLAESEERLNMGAVDPCWAFAMCYASLLLISHGEGTLQDAGWRDKVENMRRTLDKVSKRWKIAERYCESVKIALDNRRRGSYA